MIKVLALDLGTNTGVTIGDITKPDIVQPILLKLKKGKNDTDLHRSGKFFEFLYKEIRPQSPKYIIVEDNTQMRSHHSALNVHLRLMGILEAYCYMTNTDLVRIGAHDLKFHATGKRMSDKTEMVKAAQALGYTGKDDNEADSFLIYDWAKRNLNK